MATFPAPDPIQSTFLIPGSNTPGNGVQVFFYTNLTSTKTTVYKDSTTSTAWTNPIVLDSGGNLPSGGQVYINSGETLTVKYAPANDMDPPVSVYRTLNDVEGINDISVSVATNEWTIGTTPTFISATSFSVAGNQTATYTVGRRVKTTNTGGTIYGTITASVFGAVTTVTVVNDSGVLDSGLSAVEYALLASVNASVPVQRDNIFRLADNSDPTKTLAFELSNINSSTQATATVLATSGTFQLGKMPTITVLTTSSQALQSSGVYATPANCTLIKGYMIGGGNGGNAGTSSSDSANGTLGSTTAFGTTFSATASGSLGTIYYGGFATGGYINIAGSGGGTAYVDINNPSSTAVNGGTGGSSFLGGGGIGAAVGSILAHPGADNSGSGGGGGVVKAAGSAVGGFGGGSGAYCAFMIVNPVTSYTYQVGRGGLGGTSATQVTISNGADGAAGIIVLEEHYL